MYLSFYLFISTTSIYAATEFLTKCSASPGFSVALLQLIQQSTRDISVRQGAATYFKNIIKQQWVSIIISINSITYGATTNPLY